MKKYMRYLVTASLIIINIAVFLVTDFSGGTDNTAHMLRCGALYTPYVLENGEWYRLLFCCFLHFGIQHLLNNMLVLAVLGERLEIVLGRVRFLCVYLISGIGGNLVSMYFENRNGDYAVSAGASGAVFGLMGALLYLVLLNRGRLRDLSLRRILLMIAFSVYLGFADQGVNNAAHLGGLCCGFLAAALLTADRIFLHRRNNYG